MIVEGRMGQGKGERNKGEVGGVNGKEKGEGGEGNKEERGMGRKGDILFGKEERDL